MNWLYTYKDVEKLQLEITSYCNLKCPGCERMFNKNSETLENVLSNVKEILSNKQYYNLNRGPNVADHINTKHMTLQQIKDWFNVTTLPNIDTVIFSGAIDDAVSNPEFLQILKYFNETYNCEILVNTNGSLKTPKYWAEIGKLGPTVEFALDGLEDTLDIYRVGANFNKVIANAKAFINAGGYAVWKFIDFKHNTHQVDKARKLANDLGFAEFITVKSARPASSDINTPYDFTNLESSSVQCKSRKKPWLYVNYDGVMSPCCYFGYNERSQQKQDSLFHSSPKEYFEKSNFLKTLKDNWDTPECNRRCFLKCKLQRQDKREVTRFK